MDSSLQNISDLAVSQKNAAAAASTSSQIKLHGKASMATIDKESKDFASMFMTQMLQPMFDGMDVDPVFGGGHGEEVMRSFLVQEYGKAMVSDGRLGITAAVKNAMIKAQENASAALPSSSKGAAYAAVQ